MNKTSIFYPVALSGLLVFSPVSMLADNGDITFTKTTGKGVAQQFGSKKAETYDVAVLLTGKTIQGKTIKSVTVPFKSKANISNVKVWLSKKLTLATVDGRKTNVPDILTKDVTLDQDTVTVTLETPYTIDADSVYIGYTFESKAADNNSKQPVLLTSDTATDAFYIHSSRTYRTWLDYSSSGTLAIKAVLGGASADEAEAGDIGSLQGAVGQPTATTLTLTNHGYHGVQSFDYKYEVGSVSGSKHVDLAEAMPAIYGATAQVEITLPEVATKGQYPVSVTIDKVNGTANTKVPNSTGNLTVYSILPKHRAVVEEYTGTWCGWCPRGLVGLEVMNRLYPDDFIGLSYHNGDAMETMTSSKFPSVIDGYPAGWIDRAYYADAYQGWSSSGFGIDKAWLYACNDFSPAAISAEARMSADGGFVTASATTQFVEAASQAGYKIEFVLLSDSLTGTGESWDQSNYYAKGKAGGAETFPEPEFKTFYDGNSTVKGLYFPDVVIATTRTRGDDYALPADIPADQPIEATYTFDLSTAVNTSGTSLIQKRNCLRVVALLVNGKGKIVNAAKAAVNIDDYRAGIQSAKADTTLTGPATYYDLSGRRADGHAHPGITIAKDAEGHTVKTFKK